MVGVHALVAVIRYTMGLDACLEYDIPRDLNQCLRALLMAWMPCTMGWQVETDQDQLQDGNIQRRKLKDSDAGCPTVESIVNGVPW